MNRKKMKWKEDKYCLLVEVYDLALQVQRENEEKK